MAITVKELIETLQQCDPDLPVFIPAYGAEEGYDLAEPDGIGETYFCPMKIARDYKGEYELCDVTDPLAIKGIGIV